MAGEAVIILHPVYFILTISTSPCDVVEEVLIIDRIFFSIFILIGVFIVGGCEYAL